MTTISLALSVLLHAGVFVFMFFSKSKPQSLTEKIEIQLVPKFEDQMASVKSDKLESKNRKAAKTRNETGNRGGGLTKNPDTTAAIPPEFKPESGRFVPGLKNGLPLGTYDAHSEEGAYGYMDRMGLEETTSTMSFFQALWKRLDERMEYPIEIAGQRIHGNVSIHAKIDHRGQVVGELLDVNAEEKVLRTLALLLFHQSLKADLPKRYWLEEGKVTPVVFTLSFSTTTLHKAQQDEGGVFKNGVMVKRTRYIPPKLNDQIDYIMTKYMPPVIILPGFVYVDFIRAYQLIDNYVNEKPDAMVQKQRKFELLSRQLDLALTKEKLEAVTPTPSSIR